MTALNDAQHTATPAVSVFAGAEVARAAGFTLAAGARGPVSDGYVWDFTVVARLPAQLSRAAKRWDFTAVTDPEFRLVAKELLFALLARGTRRWPSCRTPTGFRWPSRPAGNG